MTMNSRKTLEKKQLKSLFWRSFTTSHAWHYERQQHMAFEFAMYRSSTNYMTKKRTG